MRRFACFLMLNVMFLGFVSADKAPSVESCFQQKTYVQKEQIFMDSTGIYVTFDEEALIPVSGVFHDGRGYFVLQLNMDTCPNGHRSPSGNGWCNNPNCVHWIGGR